MKVNQSAMAFLALLVAQGCTAFSPQTSSSRSVAQSTIDDKNVVKLQAVAMDDPNVLIGGAVVVAAAVAAMASQNGDDSGGDGTPTMSFMAPTPKIDVSIPYDAAARFAYDEWRTEGEHGRPNEKAYQEFKKLYEKMAVTTATMKKLERDMAAFENVAPKPKAAPPKPKPAPKPKVAAKKKPEVAKVDVSIPYDAAARMAYEKAGSKGDYAKFKAQYEADAVADVIKKNGPDLSIPYDAAAKLAYEKAGSRGDYAKFKAKYEADAVRDVKRKSKK